uniref:Cadherin domain-containing protein n=1 Tax=Timema monikensis TaxID=170555 RepID=A0A7R9HIX6_9NEOP|nr:unnamed protein product [Timema monikensis]
MVGQPVGRGPLVALEIMDILVSATDPDCGVNAMVNYTLGDSFAKSRHFEVRSGTGEVCISGELDFETKEVYEFPLSLTQKKKYNLVTAIDTTMSRSLVLVVCISTSSSASIVDVWSKAAPILDPYFSRSDVGLPSDDI